MSSEPKHRQVFEHFKNRILSGKVGPGSRLPSENELVKQFKTSRPTIARAMRDLLQSGLIDRKVGSGTYARQQTQHKHNLLGLLIPELGETEIFEPICGQIAQEAQAHQYSILWNNFNNADLVVKRQQALKVCKDYVARKVSGVFFAPIEGGAESDSINQQIVRALSEAGIAIMLLDRDIVAFPQRSRYDLVGIDNRRSAYVLTQHMLSMGCKQIDFLARRDSAPTVAIRIAGCREALFAAGHRYETDTVQYGDPEDKNFLKQWLKARKPDGIVCANDATAAALMHTLDTMGVTVPNEICVAGFDDVRYSRLLRVPLTTVCQPCRNIGSVALSALLDRIKNPAMEIREILIEAPIVVRESTQLR